MQNEKHTLSIFDLNMRTTSSVESFNAVLGRKCSKHPHLFKFIDQLKIVELKKALTLLCLMEPGVPNSQFEPRKKKDQERNEKIKYFTTLLVQKIISVSIFLEAMANKTIIPKDSVDFMEEY